MDKRIAIGSQVFFSEYEGFDSHDSDFVEFQDNPTTYRRFMIERKNGVHTFFYKTMSKEDFIETELVHARQLPMAAGKFIVPELIEFLGITIEDLKLFEFAFNKMDKKHLYEKKIYDSYIENDGFTLSQEQRDEAYRIYQENKLTN